MARRGILAAGAAAAAVAVGAAALLIGPGRPSHVVGTVVGADGRPVAGASVRIQATEIKTVTDLRGRFSIPDPSGEPIALAAWAEGFFIAGGTTHLPGDDVVISMEPIPAEDHPEYEWLSVEAEGTGEDQGCAACHSSGISPGPLPVDQWLADAHGVASANPRFISMYAGTDLAGNRSPDTRFVANPDYGLVPLPPDPALPYYGPGYRLDFDDSFGNCAACHTPMASIDDPYGVDPTEVSGVASEGIGCDFCHKVWDVVIDGATGLPYPNRPGVLSFEFRRPPEGHQFFAGPFDDVAPGEDTFSPLQRQSRFCAPCHHAVFWDTVVYDSYGEWLRSPYSDPATGRTCQDCHMPPSGADRFAHAGAGGLVRDPATIPGHLMPGAADPALLQEALTMTVDAAFEGGDMVVTVTLLNDLTGHHVPTDSPLRHLILLVEASGPDGQLALLEGPVVPEWCGEGDPVEGDYAGLPGTAYAKVLEELWTEVSPTGAYWNPTRTVSDNRIPAMGSDTTTYRFAGPAGDATVDVTLLFRRAFIELARQKNWEPGDIVMESASLRVPSG